MPDDRAGRMGSARCPPAQPGAALIWSRLLAWKVDATGVARMAGHANYRITLDMYAGIFDCARQAPGNPAWPRGLRRTGQLVLTHHAGLPFACRIPRPQTRSTVVVTEVTRCFSHGAHSR
jgi:hypothetical protein